MSSISYGPSIRWMDAPNIQRVVKVHHVIVSVRSLRVRVRLWYPRPYSHGHGYHPVILEMALRDSFLAKWDS